MTLTGTANAGVNDPARRARTPARSRSSHRRARRLRLRLRGPRPPTAAATPTAPPSSPARPGEPHRGHDRLRLPLGQASTTFTLLQVKGTPSGATVEVRCKGPKCPAKSFKKHNAPRVLSLKPWLRKPLRAGTVPTVTVTKPGTFGMVKTFKVRANKRPSISERCLAPDSRSRASCT